MTPLWTPDPSAAQATQLGRFLTTSESNSYDELLNWSVGPNTTGQFWRRVGERANVLWYREPDADVERSEDHPSGARWFPGGLLNYAERALRGPLDDDGSQLAVIALSDTREPQSFTWAELRTLVAHVRQGLRRAGVGAGDCVAGYLPNIPETLAAMLASASLGATWTCCAPEMGVKGVVDRLAQAGATVLIAVDGYQYRTRSVSRLHESEAIRAELPTLRLAVMLPYLRPNDPISDNWVGWLDFAADDGPLEYVPVAFDHPLYVLFSSGTTGKPKGIVHGHGGILLEHSKALSLDFDISAGDRFFWYSTTGWTMWNICVSGLVVDATVVLFDGDPVGPAGDRLWDVMATTHTTCGGVGATYLVAGMKADAAVATVHDLSSLRVLGSTGSPLPAEAAQWVYTSVKDDVLLISWSGGTDVCTGFVGGTPLHPVWPGEMSCRCLGMAVEVFDDHGQPTIGAEGELVLTQPCPSMPVSLLGDSDGTHYRETYFSRFPGVWAHGDRAMLTERGSMVITGRSDGTLNRGGIRMGTADFYRVVESMDDVADSLIVHLEDSSGGPGELVLFVVPASGFGGADDEVLAERIRATLRTDLSPRYVPDRILQVPAIPRTLSGKKLEIPVKRILGGVPVASAVSIDAVADPSSLDAFTDAARDRADERL